MEREDEKLDIKEALKEPFDYGSKEYLALIKKIHENREKYKNEQRTKSILKYKYFKDGKDM